MLSDPRAGTFSHQAVLPFSSVSGYYQWLFKQHRIYSFVLQHSYKIAETLDAFYLSYFPL